MSTIVREEVFLSDGSVVSLFPQGVPPVPPGWRWVRFPHDKERVSYDVGSSKGGWKFRRYVDAYKNDPHGGLAREVVRRTGKRMPQVYRLNPLHSTLCDCGLQHLWWDCNGTLNAKRMSSLMGDGLALMNNGAGLPGNKNCLTGEDMDAAKWPRFDQPRIMGGAVGLAKWNAALKRADIWSMLTSQPLWTAEQVLAHQEAWYWWTSVDPQANPFYVTRPSGPDSNGPDVPVRSLIIYAQPVWAPWDELHWLPDDFVPNSALWIPPADFPALRPF